MNKKCRPKESYRGYKRNRAFGRKPKGNTNHRERKELHDKWHEENVKKMEKL